MAADSTLVGAAFKEASTRAGASVPNLKPLYESSVKQVKRGLGVITGIMDELKQDELNRVAGKDAQLQEFTGLVNQMDKKLAIDKEPLPQKIIIALEKGIKDLQAEFEAVNTYGDGDTRDNERARTRINGELQKLVNSAVNTRGGMMKIGKTIKNVNGIEFTDNDRAIASQFINLEDMDSDDRVSVNVVNGQITFTSASRTGTRFVNPLFSKETKEYQYGEPVSWNIDQIIEAIPMKNLNVDARHVARLSDAQRGGAAAQAKGEAMESYNLEGAVRDIRATIKTKDDFMNIAQRELEGTKIAGFRTGLLNSGELQLSVIKSMFVDDSGNTSSLYDTFAALDTDKSGSITSADDTLTGGAKEAWKNNSMALIDMITITRNKNFNLEVSKGIISNYLADHERQEHEDAWLSADKKQNPEKYKESDNRGLTIQPGTYYRVGKGGREMGSDILAAYTPYSKGEDFNSYDDVFSFSKKSGSWTVTGPTDPKKDGSFDGPTTTRPQNETELVKNMGFDKQAQRLKFKGVTASEEDLIPEIPKGKEKETVETVETVENSSDFAFNANAKQILSSWKNRYKNMGFEYETSVGGTTVTIVAKNGKKHVAKLSSMRGDRNDQAKALNEWVEENKI